MTVGAVSIAGQSVLSGKQMRIEHTHSSAIPINHIIGRARYEHRQKTARYTLTIIDVRIGDEVRWVNHRTLPVQIDFVDKDLDGVSCQQGFTNWIGMKTESTTVGPSKSASLCFSKTGMVSYNVRMKSALPGGKEIVYGEIRVGYPGSAAADR
jgi:plastocyanin